MHAVAAVNPNTVVVVNAGSPVELPWREDVTAVLLSWFPGQEGGAALADVLIGAAEPGGRLPTTWPVALEDAPVRRVEPVGGELPTRRACSSATGPGTGPVRQPAYPFGHGLGYTEWGYESLQATATTATVRIRNTGTRTGRETVQVYVAPADPGTDRAARQLAGFATLEAAPGRPWRWPSRSPPGPSRPGTSRPTPGRGAPERTRSAPVAPSRTPG